MHRSRELHSVRRAVPRVRGRWRIALAAVACSLSLIAGADAQDARTVVADASRAMGVDGMTAIAMAGTAAYGNLGQSRTISFGLASTTIGNFIRVIDFAHSTMHTTGVAGAPAVRGNPAPGFFEAFVSADDGWSAQLDIWMTPWGFLKGAAANRATARARTIDGRRVTVVTWSPPLKAPSGQSYTVTGYIDAQNLVTRVETWVEHPIFGDMHVENFFTNYQQVGSVQVPAKMAQRRMAMETFVAVLTTINVNPVNLEELMRPVAPPAAAGFPPAIVTSTRLADDVYRIAGPYAALAVGLKDFVVVIGGGSTCGVADCSPQESEKLGAAILAETKRVFPGRPVRYIVNTHPHFDHAAMLPPFAAEGITIVTDDPNRYFIEQALSQPRTLVGDALARSKKKPKVQGVEELMVLGDASRRIELHHLLRIDHSDGMLAAYLPAERLLFAGDIEVPAPGEPPAPALLSLLRNVDRLGLDFVSYLSTRPEPAQPVSRADLAALAQQER